MMYLLLIIGFVLLIKGADFFVEGSSGIARILKIPGLIIGLTIVAMGTSAPECAVSIGAALQGSNELAISNALGSNIFNLLIVCGVCAVIQPVPIAKGILKKEYPFSIIVGAILFICCIDTFIGGSRNMISRTDAIILIVVFVGFMIWMVYSAMKSPVQEEEETKKRPVWLCLLFVTGGMAAIIYGADLVVNNAKMIAMEFGMSETLVGLTVVALGTSLPELVTSVVAARKGETEMALGNVIGSNIFNILAVLGLSGVISPMTVTGEALCDMVILTVISFLVYAFAWSKKTISRVEGTVMVLVYLVYMVYICIR